MRNRRSFVLAAAKLTASFLLVLLLCVECRGGEATGESASAAAKEGGGDLVHVQIRRVLDKKTPDVEAVQQQQQQQQQQPSSTSVQPFSGSRDVLDSLLDFLRVSSSSSSSSSTSVSGLMELRSLLLAQKEEKILLRSLVDQMRVDLRGIK